MALQLTVVTPEGQAFEGEVDQVVLPGSEGDFGVLEQHERFLTALRPGAVEIRRPGGGSDWAAVSDGFADVGADSVTVLVSHCALQADLDAAAIAEEIRGLEAQLAELSGAEEDHEARVDLELALAEARVREDVAGR